MKKFFGAIVFVLGVFFVSCGGKCERDTLYQVNLLQSLMQGYFDGTTKISDLKANGDCGIGTFNGVNGELVMLDGTVYQVLADGSVAVPDDETGIPYAAVSYFDEDISKEFNNVENLNSLSDSIYELIKQDSVNSFYLIKVTGTFKTMYSRSELKQERPYKPLAEALKTDQREFFYENVKGTVVGLYCPDYMGGLNSAGFHFHFVSDDKTKGGHVFGLTADKLKVQLDRTVAVKIALDTTEEFNRINLAKDMTNDMNKVEKGK